MKLPAEKHGVKPKKHEMTKYTCKLHNDEIQSETLEEVAGAPKTYLCLGILSFAQEPDTALNLFPTGILGAV